MNGRLYLSTAPGVDAHGWLKGTREAYEVRAIRSVERDGEPVLILDVSRISYDRWQALRREIGPGRAA